MGTREVVEKLPENIRDHIEDLRKYYKGPVYNRAEVRAELYGYTMGLRDGGAITERERKILFVYGTV